MTMRGGSVCSEVEREECAPNIMPIDKFDDGMIKLNEEECIKIHKATSQIEINDLTQTIITEKLSLSSEVCDSGKIPSTTEPDKAEQELFLEEKKFDQAVVISKAAEVNLIDSQRSLQKVTQVNK